MKTTLILGLLALLFSFSACKDSGSDEVTLTNPSLLIKSATRYQGTSVMGSSTYEYDEKGRITTITNSQGKTEKYSYVADTMILVENSNHDFYHYTDTLLLNDKGLVISQNGASVYTYDSQGYLITSLVDGNYSSFLLSGGNIAESSYIPQLVGDSVSANYAYAYQYLPESVNTIGNENMGITFFGKQNKNLVSRTHTVRNLSDGTVTSYDYSYSYQIDPYNRVIRKTQEGAPVPSYTVYTYND